MSARRGAARSGDERRDAAARGRADAAPPALPRVGFQVWGQAVGWPALRDTARRVETLGFSSLWANDHFSAAAGAAWTAPDAPIGPFLEGWATLAGFAGVTERIRLGMLVSGAGYRNVGLLVKQATAVDHLSSGRVTLGLGAGWHEPEHRAFGFGLLPIRDRLDRLEEQAEAIRRLLDGDAVTLRGRWVTLDGARNLPPPVGPLPLLIGGGGLKRTLRIVAEFADAWNGEGDPATWARKNAVLDEHCAAVGRDPGRIRRTAGVPPICIRDDAEGACDDLIAALRRAAMAPDDAAALAASSPFVGPEPDVVASLAAYAAAGADEVIADLPGAADVETMERLAAALGLAARGG